MFIKDEFRSANERILNEWVGRKENLKNQLKFGVDFLDRSLSGILPTDLILVGGASGGGKTEFVTTVAMNNAMEGKNVYFFALEAEDSEIERRMKYKFLVHRYKQDPEPLARIFPNFTDWYLGKLDYVFSKYEADLHHMGDALKTLHTFYRSKDFGLRDFKKHALMVAEKADLIILDHLHYFDLESDNENKEYTEIIKLIRDIVLISKVPVMLVAHIRKSDQRAKKIVPEMEDFQGSSNLFKVPTKCILLSGGGMVSLAEPGLFYTYFSIAKNRIDGARTKFIGRTVFDSEANEYRAKFELGTLSPDKTEFQPIHNPSHVPRWLRGD